MPEVSDLSHFIRTNALQTLSLIFRRTVLHNLPAIYHTVPYNDYLLKIMCAQKGYVGFLNEVMGVYRMHGNGMVMSNKVRFLEMTLENLRMISEYNPSCAMLLESEAAKVRGELLANLLVANGFPAFRTCLGTYWQSSKGIGNRIRMGSLFFAEFVKNRLARYFPGFFFYLKNIRHFSDYGKEQRKTG